MSELATPSTPGNSAGPGPDGRAAHELLCEMRTRIATQPLPYQYGVETRALESLVEIFQFARKAMKDNPGCAHFARITTTMLNVDLRPITAKWHRAYKAGVLDSRDGANDFRTDLAALQPRLASFAEELQKLAYGNSQPDVSSPPVVKEDELADCLSPCHLGLMRRTPAGKQSIPAKLRKSMQDANCKASPHSPALMQMVYRCQEAAFDPPLSVWASCRFSLNEV